MILSQADIGLLKELKAAGERGCIIRGFNNATCALPPGEGRLRDGTPDRPRVSPIGSHSVAETRF
jgi:hypothetical protein